MTVKAICAHCESDCRLTDGAEIYTHRADLHSLKFWICDKCDAYVGCHKPGNNTRKGNADGTLPMGTAANKELRKLRHTIHRLIDPYWEQADHKIVQRKELYALLTLYGHMMKFVPKDQAFHVSTLTVESAKVFVSLFEDFTDTYYPYGVRQGSRVRA